MAASLPGGAARSCRAKARGPIWAGAAAILALAGCGGEGSAARGRPSSRIAFVSERDGNAEICVMNADGSGLTRLTNPGYSHHWPAWSRDGTKIVFERHSGFDTEGEVNPVPNIYVISADGSGLRRLTRTGEAEDHGPAWSPDGTTLAFVRRGRGGSPDIWVMNADGCSGLRLTNAPEDDTGPNWSPDGTRLAFVRRERERSSDI